MEHTTGGVLWALQAAQGGAAADETAGEKTDEKAAKAAQAAATAAAFREAATAEAAAKPEPRWRPGTGPLGEQDEPSMSPSAAASAAAAAAAAATARAAEVRVVTLSPSEPLQRVMYLCLAVYTLDEKRSNRRRGRTPREQTTALRQGRRRAGVRQVKNVRDGSLKGVL